MKHIVSVELLEKFMNNQCTPDEVALVYSWISQYRNNDDYISTLSASQQMFIREKMLGQILLKIEQKLN